MAASSNRAEDLWDEIIGQEQRQSQSQEEEEQPRIAVIYGPKTAALQQSKDLPRNMLGKENRVSFAPTKRTSWNRSLSIRGRESILVAIGVEFQPQPKQKGAKKIPKPGRRGKKDQKGPPDFKKEKAYFAEVDSFELLEESPSPKTFGSWKLARRPEMVVHDLPAILKRWKISKAACSCQISQPLCKILETPRLVPSATSSNDQSGYLSSKTTERATKLRGQLNFTSYERSAKSRSSVTSTMKLSQESSIITSLNALSIKEEDESDTCEASPSITSGDIRKELEGGIRKESMITSQKSLPGEYLSAFAQLLMVCQQPAPIALSEVFSVYCDPNNILKLGEGTYGEAFRAGDTVCKVVPIDGDILVNGEIQKKSEEVLEEVLLSLTLNGLRPGQGETTKCNACASFIETKDFRICRGVYDSALIRAWEDWDAKHGSENDHPQEFPDSQCYIVFVLANGGQDLESFILVNFDEARSLLVQVTAALAVAEVACEFEHRDLHWGNILIARQGDKLAEFVLGGRKMRAQTYGLAISIIDFTLSRINTGEAILFLDLSADPALFEGPKGDKQAETYRKMKAVTGDYWEGSIKFPLAGKYCSSHEVSIPFAKCKQTAGGQKQSTTTFTRTSLSSLSPLIEPYLVLPLLEGTSFTMPWHISNSPGCASITTELVNYRCTPNK